MNNLFDKYLIPEWRESWRYASVQAAAVAGTVGATIAGYPDLIITLAAMMGGTPQLQAVVIAFVIVVVALRLWNQEAGDADEE